VVSEVLIVTGCLALYFLIRGAVVDRPAIAFAHAADLIRVEQRLGVFWEPAWQQAMRGDLVQVRLWDAVYFWGHAPVIALVAVWLYRRHRPVYGVIRTAFLVSALLALLGYQLYPVAPPRLLTQSGYAAYGLPAAAYPDFGFVDTMRQFDALSYQAESLKPFVNPFAAMPSLHFGWAVLLALGVAAAVRRRWSAVLPIVWSGLTLCAIVFTANHFILDAVAGLVDAGIGLGVALFVRRARLAGRTES
jgi:PAP2 superfamily